MDDLTSASQIRLYLDECYEVRKNTKDKIERMKVNLFSPKELREEKRNLKLNFLDVDMEIGKYQKIMDDYVTFDRDTFLNFLKEYFSSVLGESYDLIEGISDNSHKSFDKKYNIILALSDKNLLYEINGDFKTETTVKEFLEPIGNRYICLEDDLKYSLLKYSFLREEFRHFYFLESVADDLIDLKLSGYDDEERLNLVLGNSKVKKLR